MQIRIKLGISKCLLGEKVRYDGGHKLNHYLKDVMGPFVEWVPVCPEVECGLPVPRESMRLLKNDNDLRLITEQTGIDHTDRMQTWIRKKLKELEDENMCGFIFKTKSPSSGMRDVKIYSEKSHSVQKGAGMFAGAFMNHFMYIPAEDEGRFQDAGLRKNFIERIFIYHRWLELFKDGTTPNKLIHFHTQHKYCLMAHSPKHLRELGVLIANAKGENSYEINATYLSTLMTALKLKATVKKNVNVLLHIVGQFKKILTPDEKQELLEIIEQYHQHLIPLIVPITLLKHYTRKYNVPFLKQQAYLNPHPIELMLRNHA